MRFRQVHLDFHTSEAIHHIGQDFNKEQFQDMLRLGHVDSITVFSKCHHGWAYHPSEVNEMHPHLDFDLLGAQIEAAHEMDVKTPIYVSAGLDEKLARRHPEWLIRDEKDRTNWADGFMMAGYHQFCLNTPYLDILISQVEEVVTNYEGDGIFLDIVGVRKCYCQYCVRSVQAAGEDPRNLEAMKKIWERTYASYTSRVKEAVDAIKPNTPIFHNGGHIRCGRRDLAQMNSHLEVESLPTGGWGYDHFPLSARYVQTLGMDYLGMTGKFHLMWGDFGGFKHPNALRYETALSLANGARCSIGDQLHPEGIMDPATYRLIGTAYSEVERKEAWCSDVTSIADIAILSSEAAGVHESGQDQSSKVSQSDSGVVRILLEGKYLFDVIDLEEDFNKYKVIILPDMILITDSLKLKLEDYFHQGGKVLATGRSGLQMDESDFAIDLGVKWLGSNPYRPDYFRPDFTLQHCDNTGFVMYSQGQRIELQGGVELGYREDPYFNRDVFTFCSHRHTPSSMNHGGPGMVKSNNGIYIAWDVFDDYAANGTLILKEMVCHALNELLPNISLKTNLPSQGITTLMDQKEKKRLVHHLLYASPVKRGKVEVIEDVLPIYNIENTLSVPYQIKKIYLAPEMDEIDFEIKGETVSYVVPKLECHQMVVMEYEG